MSQNTKKYFSKTILIDLEKQELGEKIVEKIIEEMQSKYSGVVLNSVHQSIMSGGIVGNDKAMITVVMEKDVLI